MSDDRTTPRTFYRGVVNSIPQYTPGLRTLQSHLLTDTPERSLCPNLVQETGLEFTTVQNRTLKTL